MSNSQPNNELSHVDDEGRARMVDVSGKSDTSRTAVAVGEFSTTAAVVALIRAEGMPKADVLSTARIAGISAAKKTSELIPLCHQVALSAVEISFELRHSTIRVEATAKTRGPTGVEMEALTAVAVTGLTLHDMVKAVDPEATMNGIRLLTKDGGKTGHWTRTESAQPTSPLPTSHLPTSPLPTSIPEVAPNPKPQTGTATVLVASTGGARGTRDDTTGPFIAEWLTDRGYTVRGPLLYADADIADGLRDALDGPPALIISTGGTGASPTDATPEATFAMIDRELPGIADAIRTRGLAKTPHAVLSRGVAGLIGNTVVVNLPGSPGGVKDGLSVLEPLLAHLIAQVAGGGSHDE